MIRLSHRFARLLRAVRPFRSSCSCPIPQNSETELNREALVDLYEACREFVRRCECGEVRSRRSYQQMKAAIKKAEIKLS